MLVTKSWVPWLLNLIFPTCTRRNKEIVFIKHYCIQHRLYKVSIPFNLQGDYDKDRIKKSIEPLLAAWGLKMLLF